MSVCMCALGWGGVVIVGHVFLENLSTLIKRFSTAGKNLILLASGYFYVKKKCYLLLLWCTQA